MKVPFPWRRNPVGPAGRRGRAWCLAAGAALAWGLGPGLFADSQSDTTAFLQGKKVLVLCSYHYGMRWTDSICAGIRSVFDDPQGKWHVLQYEFMDAKRISSPEYFEELARLFAMKFKPREFDVIIASDDDALSFLLQYRERLFESTPVVFCGVNYFQPEMLANQSDITGVVESFDLVATLDAALMLHPNAKLVYVVNDQSSTGRANNRRIEDVMPRYAERAHFRFTGPASMAELLEEIRGLPDNAVILLMTFNRDRLGEVFRYRDAARLVTGATPLPVYGVWAFYLGDGIVGGMLTRGETHGRAAAEMAMRILGGERAESIPVILQCPNQYMFDYNQLRRLGINVSKLPPGSLVIHKPEPMYRFRKQTVWLVVSALAVLGLLVLAHAINVNKRLQAQHALQEANEKVRRESADRRQAEQERERLAAAVAQMSDGVIISDSQGVICYVNPALERMTGYQSAELLGQSARIFGRPEDVRQVRQVLEALRHSENWRGRMRTRRKDGTLRDEDVLICPVKDSAGRVGHYLAIRRDVTESVALQNQLMETQKIETVGEIAGGIAHDFNNMLTVILTSAQFLADGVAGDPKLRKDAGEIVRTAKRASELARELLTFCRKQPLELKARNVNEIVFGLEAMFHHILGERVRLVLDLTREACIAQVDKGRLEQALANLVMNARDAIPAQGVVTLRTALARVEDEPAAEFLEPPMDAAGRFVRISVQDTGTGIPENIRQRIFEPLFTTKPAEQGTGLGLSVVYGIIKQHGGRLALATQVGRGSTFKIYLPAAYIPPANLAATGAIAPVPSGRESILLVEDERSVRDVIARIMTHLGYKVTAADCAESALELMDRTTGPLDLLFTDIVMPGMDGVSLAREVLRRRPGLRIVFASGYSQEHLSKDPKFACIPLLKKPFEAGDLARLIRRVLDGPEQRPGPAA
ncbi:MAG TPA: PAS domain S-box protein [Kiritimatiellia bacterium]|nr:PAS domain S-box protein [Kiritimatiellia bacterium]HRZ12983.1 PAS domain S-box protein [Kiritimatiellia bacterium]HSA18407.1 PAS domain S-box protein [Kiritimatiellia bacterium]